MSEGFAPPAGARAASLEVRQPTLSQLDALYAVERAAHGAHGWSRALLEAELTSERAHIWAAYDATLEGEIAAFIVVWEIAGEIELQDVATHPARQRRGIARALLGALLDEVAGRGFGPVLLEVRAHNAPAIALYEGLGFSQVGRRARYYADGADALLMRWSAP